MDHKRFEWTIKGYMADVFLESDRAVQDGDQHGRFLNRILYGPLKWTIKGLRDSLLKMSDIGSHLS
jgi:hypothetical protein